MSIDIQNETILDPRQAVRLPILRNPRTGKPAHLSQFYRWVQSGACAADGGRIRLETVRCPSGLRTSVEAVERFIEALTSGDGEQPSIRTPRRRAADIAQAEKELAEAGI